MTGVEVSRYLENNPLPPLSDVLSKAALHEEERTQKWLLENEGSENVYLLHNELSDWMVRYASVKRDDEDLVRAMAKIKELRKRYQNISLADRGRTLNQGYVFAHQFRAMLELALVIVKGALLRNEFRGSHYKPNYPERDDENWLKTTIAEYEPDEPRISYEPVDMRHLDPIKRDYTHAKKVKPTLKNIPTNIQLPL